MTYIRILLLTFSFFFSFNILEANDTLLLSIKSKIVVLDQDEKNEYTAHFRMAKMDSIWASISGFLGFEGARMIIKKDSTYIHNLIENTMVKISNDQGNDLIPYGFTMEEWHTILTNDIIPPSLDSNIESLRENDLVLYKVFTPNKLKQLYFDSMSNIEKMSITRNDLNSTCEVFFSNFIFFPPLNRPIAYTKLIVIKSEYNNISIKIMLESIKEKKDLDMPFTSSIVP